MNRAWYSSSILEFLAASRDEVLGSLARCNQFELTEEQRRAWIEQIDLLKRALVGQKGTVYLEFAIPRMGTRVDALVILGPVLFVIEFKIGESTFHARHIDQVVDYALDLHNFHEGSHDHPIAPVLVCTEAVNTPQYICPAESSDGLLPACLTNAHGLSARIATIMASVRRPPIVAEAWEASRYRPTPTIVEATLALYRGHSVAEISRSDSGATNLTRTASTVAAIVADAKANKEKGICFVTGVPGAGKTLVGLDAATKHLDPTDDLYSVFLSGNGPLVAILQEALAQDQVEQKRKRGITARKSAELSKVKTFIQNVHHFRDECLRDTRPPVEHIAIFDEAQRAWTLEQTANFMRQKKGYSAFNQSEPEFLVSCLDRHADWAVVICLVGGGQEINVGEAGISEWMAALRRSFPGWKVYVSDRITDVEYGAGKILENLRGDPRVVWKADLHLATSMRSFRAENVSNLAKAILDLELQGARRSLEEVKERYPIALTRDLRVAKSWLRSQARGSERYGIVASSYAERLKPHALDVKTPLNYVHWFLKGKDHVHSSYYLEDVATEFHVQGLELDWTAVVWDADFRYGPTGWENWRFRGNRWEHIRSAERQMFQKNAYRVLLTRARQGMMLVVPNGDPDDPTRHPSFYDHTFEYLQSTGIQVL